MHPCLIKIKASSLHILWDSFGKKLQSKLVYFQHKNRVWFTLSQKTFAVFKPDNLIKCIFGCIKVCIRVKVTGQMWSDFSIKLKGNKKSGYEKLNISSCASFFLYFNKHQLITISVNHLCWGIKFVSLLN